MQVIKAFEKALFFVFSSGTGFILRSDCTGVVVLRSGQVPLPAGPAHVAASLADAG